MAQTEQVLNQSRVGPGNDQSAWRALIDASALPLRKLLPEKRWAAGCGGRRTECPLTTCAVDRTRAVFEGLREVLQHHACSDRALGCLEHSLYDYLVDEATLSPETGERVWMARAKFLLAFPMSKYLRNPPPPSADKPFKFTGFFRRWAKARLNAFNRKNTHLWYSWLQAKRAAMPVSVDVVDAAYRSHFEALTKPDSGDDNVINAIMREPAFKRLLNMIAIHLERSVKQCDETLRASSNACYTSSRKWGGQAADLASQFAGGKAELKGEVRTGYISEGMPTYHDPAFSDDESYSTDDDDPDSVSADESSDDERDDKMLDELLADYTPAIDEIDVDRELELGKSGENSPPDLQAELTASLISAGLSSEKASELAADLAEPDLRDTAALLQTYHESWAARSREPFQPTSEPRHQFPLAAGLILNRLKRSGVGPGEDGLFPTPEFHSMEFFPCVKTTRVEYNCVVTRYTRYEHRNWTRFIRWLERSVADCDESEPLRAKIQAVREPLKVRVISKGPAENYYLASTFQKSVHSLMRRLPIFRLIGRTICPTDLMDLVPQAEADESVGGPSRRPSSETQHVAEFPPELITDPDHLPRSELGEIIYPPWFGRSEPSDPLRLKRERRIDPAGDPGIDWCWFSGDYVASTDNLSWRYSRRIMWALTQRLPKHLRKNFRRCLAGHKLVYPHRTCSQWPEMAQLPPSELCADGTPADDAAAGLQRDGQLMGSVVSFLVLCLANYGVYLHTTAYERAVGLMRDDAVLVNGDDILFRAPSHLWHRYERTSAAVGLKLSPGKAYLHPSYANVNSTSFHFSPRERAATPWQIDYLNAGLLLHRHKVQKDGDAYNWGDFPDAAPSLEYNLVWQKDAFLERQVEISLKKAARRGEKDECGDYIEYTEAGNIGHRNDARRWVAALNDRRKELGLPPGLELGPLEAYPTRRDAIIAELSAVRSPSFSTEHAVPDDVTSANIDRLANNKSPGGIARLVVGGSLPGAQKDVLHRFLRYWSKDLNAEATKRTTFPAAFFLPECVGGLGLPAPPGWHIRVTREQRQMAGKFLARIGAARSVRPCPARESAEFSCYVTAPFERDALEVQDDGKLSRRISPHGGHAEAKRSLLSPVVAHDPVVLRSRKLTWARFCSEPTCGPAESADQMSQNGAVYRLRTRCRLILPC